ncbi:GNAT family N-acetyltransferase [Morganella morganii]|uniref:GNAT family N-acetyltransferase n=1 Tax=Morganella morganii TaxID=582 RepID=UPI0022AD9A98|nr:GNAT family N-acetyltransferase [Morganella morganii]
MKSETERLILRPWAETDAADLYEAAKDDRVGPIAGWPPHSCIEESADVIRTVFNLDEVYATELKANGRAVGCIGILIGENSNFDISQREGEIAYWIGVPYWGQGLIPEAIREVMRHAFETLELEALWCGYFENNEQSHRAQAKCGFRHHHTEENKFNPFLNDYRTEHISRITREEWLAQQ